MATEKLSSTTTTNQQHCIFSDSGSGDCISDEQINKSINPIKILNLCANLSSYTTSINIQIILNKFLQEITNAPYAIIVPILLNHEECLIQVIGDKVLDNEMRFTITRDDVQQASANDYKFFISELNCNFKEVVEMLVGTEHNMLIFDIGELNKNERTTLPQMIPIDEISLTSSSTGETNCSTHLYDNDNLQTVFVCLAGDESCRIYYRYCIYETLRFTIGHLFAAIQLDEGRRVRKQCQKLLGLYQNLLPKIDGELIDNENFAMKIDMMQSTNLSNKFPYESNDYNNILQCVVSEAESLTGAERCNLFLRDKNTGELITSHADDNNKFQIHENIKGLVSYVAENGELLNIPNTIYHPLYNKYIDEHSGSKSQNMLCSPICIQNSTIGVIELCNKYHSYHFDKCDEEVVKAFSTYTGIAIINSLIKKSVQKAEANHKISHELINYHINISDEEVNELVEMLENISDNKIPDLRSFTFGTRDLNLKQTFQASLQMFVDLDYIKKFKINPAKLARFLLTVQKGYRNLPFHNWIHAFAVAHFAYTLIMNCKLFESGIMSELESFAFQISAFCHDLDHRGRTNFYHEQFYDILAQLYSKEGSINERHHYTLTVHILKEDNTNILDNLKNDELEIFFDATRNFILATDLSHHIYILKQLLHSNRESISRNRHMTMSLLITCCDLSDQIKIWPNVLQVSELIYKEFFLEGDLIRQSGIVPKEMFDRQKAFIPRFQIHFIVDVVLPGFKILGNILPETKYLLDIIDDNLQHWYKEKEIYRTK